MFKSGFQLSAHVREHVPPKFKTQRSTIYEPFEWHTQKGDDDREKRCGTAGVLVAR
jgi:hypothetical protein